MPHLDMNGAELHVGDLVRYGNREGTVLILEDWSKLGPAPSLPNPWQTDQGCYVSGLGQWGDARAIPASLLERIG